MPYSKHVLILMLFITTFVIGLASGLLYKPSIPVVNTRQIKNGADKINPSESTLSGPVQYNCELSGGSFIDEKCKCDIETELGQTQEMMYDKNTGYCQSTNGGPAGDAFNASIGLPYGDYSYWTPIIMKLCTDSGGSISGVACVCPTNKKYSKINGTCE